VAQSRPKEKRIMKQLRNRIEKWFESTAIYLFRNRIKTLVIILALTLAVISQLPKITVDISTEGFLHKDDPTLTDYNDFRDQFGRDELILIAIRTENVFNQNFLLKLKSLHKEIEECPVYKRHHQSD
jgi:predicted RND superfamily exporter protein